MKRVLEVGDGYGGKFESCAQLIAMDDELQNHDILYTLILRWIPPRNFPPLQ
jgi:hypothetical protein